MHCAVCSCVLGRKEMTCPLLPPARASSLKRETEQKEASYSGQESTEEPLPSRKEQGGVGQGEDM